MRVRTANKRRKAREARRVRLEGWARYINRGRRNSIRWFGVDLASKPDATIYSGALAGGRSRHWHLLRERLENGSPIEILSLQSWRDEFCAEHDLRLELFGSVGVLVSPDRAPQFVDFQPEGDPTT